MRKNKRLRKLMLWIRTRWRLIKQWRKMLELPPIDFSKAIMRLGVRVITLSFISVVTLLGVIIKIGNLFPIGK